MRSYDPSRPMIFIHVPKTAGTSVRKVVEGWFPDRLHFNYFNRHKWCVPEPLPPETLWNSAAPPVIYGHFNRDRDFGIAHLYPDVRQFVTILRDPFEAAVSHYFFARKRTNVPNQRKVPDTLAGFLAEERPNILNHFPSQMTLENYRDILEDQFVEIGVTERLPQSLDRIAQALGQSFDPASLPVLNTSKRDQPAPEDARARYAEKFPLEHAVYAYALARYDEA